MTTVFIYEDVTATWADGDAKSPPALSLLAEGQAMLVAVTTDFPGEPPTLVGGGGLTPPANAGGSPWFREMASRSDYTLLIAPETGGRLEYLAKEVLRVGGRLLGPSPEAIRLTADKLLLAHHWEQHGVQTPKTWPLGQEPDDRTVVMKPRDGAGSQAMFLASVDALASRSCEMIAQDYIPGFAASVALLIGPNGIVPLIPCEQRFSADGRFHYQGGSLPIRPDLAERAVNIATAAVRCVPGLLGYVGVDVVLGNDGRDWAIEINPRITTSYVGLRALAKFNLAEAMLAAVEARELPAMEWRDRQIEFTPDARDSIPAAASTSPDPTSDRDATPPSEARPLVKPSFSSTRSLASLPTITRLHAAQPILVNTRR